MFVIMSFKQLVKISDFHDHSFIYGSVALR